MPPPDIPLTADRTGVTLSVYVTPRASRSEVAGEREGALWVRLAAPPVDGKANAALISLLADWLGVPKAHVEIVSGETARRKRIRIAPIDAPTLRSRLLSPPEGR
jgi:uncharacterized protein